MQIYALKTGKEIKIMHIYNKATKPMLVTVVTVFYKSTPYFSLSAGSHTEKRVPL